MYHCTAGAGAPRTSHVSSTSAVTNALTSAGLRTKVGGARTVSVAAASAESSAFSALHW